MTPRFHVGMKVYSAEDNRIGIILELSEIYAEVRVRGRGTRTRNLSDLTPLTPAGYFLGNAESILADSLKKGDVAILNTKEAFHGTASVKLWERGIFQEIYYSEQHKCWKAYVKFPTYGNGWHGLLQELIMFDNVSAKDALEKL